jgi:hypothetical protein
MKKLTIYSLTIAFLLALVDGCVSPAGDSAPPVPVAGSGVVRSQLPILLVSVDGKPGPSRLSGSWGHMLHFYGDANKPYAPFDLSLEPGPHSLEFVYVGGGQFTLKPLSENLNVEAGRVYKVDALIEGGVVRFGFRQIETKP